MRSRSAVDHNQQQQQLYKNAPGRHRVGGGQGYKASPPPPPHHAPYMPQQRFHGMQQQQQAVMMMQGQQQGSAQHVAGFGRRDARHDPYLTPRSGNGNMMNGRYQQHHTGRAGSNIGRHGQQQQQQFFVNGNPAGVNCPPQQQSRMNAAAAHAGGAYRGGNCNNGPVVEAFLPRHAAGGVTGGVAMAPAPPAAQVFLSRVGGGLAGVVPRSAAPGGVGAHTPVPFQAGNSSQFSMWRSQVVFAPVLQMQ